MARATLSVAVLAAALGAGLTALGYELLTEPCSECSADRTLGQKSSPAVPHARARRADHIDGARTSDADHADGATDDHAQIEELRAEIARLEAENEELTERKLEDDPRYYGFSEAELELLARSCDVRSDGVPLLSDTMLAEMGLRAGEREILERVVAEFKEHEAIRKRALLAEIGADLDEYDALDGLHQEVFFFTNFGAVDSDNPDRDREIQQLLAEERAGLRAGPSAAELARARPYVRFLRAILTEGDRFAEALAEELGAERVHELRTAGGGWPGGGRRHTGCPEE